MELFTERVNLAMEAKGYKQVDLCTATKESSSKISLIVNGKVTDPRLSTAVKIAEALDVSLDYLAGRTDNPLGICDEELDGLRIDAESRALLDGFSRLAPDGRRSISEQVEFQLSKSTRMRGNTVSEEGVAEDLSA